ncbi:hypothetical protein EBX31_04975 [bacterium]|nr:hypothetical protein [bacterium]
MSEEKRRPFIAVDLMATLEIGKYCSARHGATIRSVWLAMELLAYRQRNEHHGRAFVTNQPHLAKIAEVSVPTVKRVCAFLAEIGLLTVTSRKTSGCRRDFNHYAMKYPATMDHGELWNHSSVRCKRNELDIKRGGALLPPAADAASPLVLRGKNAPAQKEKKLSSAGSSGQGDRPQLPAIDPEAAAKAEQERRAAEAKSRAEWTARHLADQQRRDELRKAEQAAAAEAERRRRQRDHDGCMSEFLTLLEKRDFDPTDYSGGLLVAIEFYDRDVVEWAITHLPESLADRWRKAEAEMIKDGAITAPIVPA